MKRRIVLLDHVVLEARALIDAEYTGYPASDGPVRPTNRTADRSPRSFTFARLPPTPPRLGLSLMRQNQSDRNRGDFDRGADRKVLPSFGHVE
jgi:hypothetical protein